MFPCPTYQLQTLKKKLNLEKDTEEDETVLQNTYNPEQGSPRFTKNKRREREISEKVNTNSSTTQEETRPSKGKKKSKRELPAPPVPDDTPSYIQAEDTQALKSELSLEPDDGATGKEPKRRSKKGRSKGELEAKAESQVVDAEDQLLRDYQQQIAQEDDTKKTAVKKTDKDAASQEVVLNNDVGKKKKKKLKSLNTETEARCVYLFL